MLSILWALIGSTMGAVGMVLQKKGIRWMDLRKSKEKNYLKFFLVWISGICVSYVLSAFPNSMASNKLPPHIITAMAGWEIVVIVFLSWFFLRERIYKTDLFYALVIVGSTVVIGLRSKPSDYIREQIFWKIFLFVLPVVFLLPFLFKSFSHKIKASLLSVYAGCMGGLALVYFNIVVREIFAKGFQGTPVKMLVLYILSAVLGVIFEQASYRIGEMTVVASIRLSLYIIYPVFCSMLLFKTDVDILQFISIAMIVFACYGIFKKR